MNSSEDVDAILKIALNKSGGTDELRVRMQRSAEELGITPEALAQAEAEFAQVKLLSEYKASRWRALGGDLSSYIPVNLMLIGIWFFTGRDFFWPIFPMMGWGIAIFGSIVRAIGAQSATITDSRFQAWREKRDRKSFERTAHSRSDSNQDDD